MMQDLNVDVKLVAGIHSDEAIKAEKVRVLTANLLFCTCASLPLPALDPGFSRNTNCVQVISYPHIFVVQGCKTVMNDEERLAVVKGCKWVDDVVTGSIGKAPCHGIFLHLISNNVIASSHLSPVLHPHDFIVRSRLYHDT